MSREVGGDQHDGVVEVGLVEIAEGGIAQDRGGFEHFDQRMGAQMAQQPHETASGIADIAADAQHCGVSAADGAGILPRKAAVEKEGQIRSGLPLQLQSTTARVGAILTISSIRTPNSPGR